METGCHVRLYVFIIYVLKIIITVRSHVFMQQFNSLFSTTLKFGTLLYYFYLLKEMFKGAVTRLKEVFKGHQELILGFGTFLSSDYNKTTLQRKKEKPVTIIRAHSFAKVKVKIYTTFSYVLINTCFCSTFIFFYVSLLKKNYFYLQGKV